jgi:hypothetical protein
MRNRSFVLEYVEARSRWCAVVAAVFPQGTYWLHRFAAAPVSEM